MLSGWQRLGVLVGLASFIITWIVSSNQISKTGALLGQQEFHRIYEDCQRPIDAAYEKKWRDKSLLPQERPDYSDFIENRARCRDPADEAMNAAIQAHADSHRWEAMIMAAITTLGLLLVLSVCLAAGRWVRRGYKA